MVVEFNKVYNEFLKHVSSLLFFFFLIEDSKMFNLKFSNLC